MGSWMQAEGHLSKRRRNLRVTLSFYYGLLCALGGLSSILHRPWKVRVYCRDGTLQAPVFLARCSPCLGSRKTLMILWIPGVNAPDGEDMRILEGSG